MAGLALRQLDAVDLCERHVDPGSLAAQLAKGAPGGLRHQVGGEGVLEATCGVLVAEYEIGRELVVPGDVGERLEHRGLVLQPPDDVVDFPPTDWCGHRAPGVEPAPLRGAGRVGHGAFESHQRCVGVVFEVGTGLQQGTGVGVAGVVEDGLRCPGT